jgi:PAS domain S-box-containing protein
MSESSIVGAAPAPGALLTDAVASAVGHASCIVAVDADGTAVYVNDAFCELVGWPREQLLGERPPFCYWPPEHVAEIQAAFGVGLAGGHPSSGRVLTFRRRSGERFPVLLILTSTGPPERRRWVANAIDLSVPAAQIESLAQSERRLRIAQEAGHVGLWELDLATGETWRSPACERLNGLAPGSHPRHEEWLQRVHVDDRPLVDKVRRDSLQPGETFTVEFRYRLDSGEERWLQSRGQLQRDASGRPERLIGINVDVTERRRAMIELEQYRRELESRVAEDSGLLAERSAELVRTQLALDRAGIGIAWNDAVGGRFAYVNDEACRQLGYTREELLQLSIADVEPRLAGVPLREIVDDLRRRGIRKKLETLFRRKDGSTYPVEVTYYLDLMGGGEQLICFYNDLSGRARLEEDLRISEQRWKFALEGAGQGVWDWDHETGRVYYSPGYKRMLGYDEHEFGDSAADWSGRIHPDDRPEIERRVDRYFRGELPAYDLEFRMRRRDGQYAWIQSRGMVVERTAAGAPKRIIGTHTDITARKHAELAEAEARRELEATLDSMGAGFVACDDDWRVLYVNAEAERLLGVRRAEVVGRNHWDVFPASGGPDVQAYFRLAAAGEPQDFEHFSMQRQRWFHSRCFPRKGGGMSVFFRDVTERKALDAALHDAKVRAEAASAAKSAFLANMSHEIRTPLNGVIGMAHLLRLGGLSPEQAERLDRLEHSANHLLEVLNAVLDLSKIEAGRLVLEEGPVRVESVVADVVGIVEEDARRRHLQVRCDIGACPTNLLGDATRMQQALLNYVGNAVKFTERGSITIRVRCLSEDASGAVLRFEVTDTGPGIEPDVLHRLFASFEQGDRSTTRKSGGTGLGLAITRKLAELMGGQAGAESRPGAGSTFWFTVHCRQDDVPAAEVVQVAPQDVENALRARHGGARLLLAEDNDINREVAVALLEDVGLVVETAEDGSQALANAAAGDYALVLMDVQMPVLDGLEATRAIRVKWPRGTLPIVAMTASAFSEDKARCEAAGMDDFLSKPVEPPELYALLLRWLDTRRAPHPDRKPGSATA